MRILDTIYLDHQASTPVDEQVLSAMGPFYRESCANPHSSDHILGWQAAQVIEENAAVVASLIGAATDEIIFTSGATEANNQAILGLCNGARNTPRNRIIVSAIEHKCVLAAAEAARDLFDAVVEIAPVNEKGEIDTNWLENNLDESVLLVSIIAVNNEIGTIQDIETLSSLSREVGAVLHTDCAQAPTSMDLSEISQFVDMLSLSAHKMYGPKGIGALYMERSIQERVSPIIFGGGQQQNKRSGTLPTQLVVGMGVAASIHGGPNAMKDRSHLSSLRDHFISSLQELGVELILISPTETSTHPANANIRFVGCDANDILQSIQPHVAASTGSACTSGSPEPSHVLRAIGLSHAEASECIRFSVGRGTTSEDIEDAAAIIRDATCALRS